jgi:hypothetical protein
MHGAAALFCPPQPRKDVCFSSTNMYGLLIAFLLAWSFAPLDSFMLAAVSTLK